MHEKTGNNQLMEQILDHPSNAGMDPHNRRDLVCAMKNMTGDELLAELERLGNHPENRTKVKSVLTVTQ